MKHYIENALRDVNAAIRSVEAAQERLDEPNASLDSCLFNLRDERQRLEGILQLVEAGADARLRPVSA